MLLLFRYSETKGSADSCYGRAKLLLKDQEEKHEWHSGGGGGWLQIPLLVLQKDGLITSLEKVHDLSHLKEVLLWSVDSPYR